MVCAVSHMLADYFDQSLNDFDERKIPAYDDRLSSELTARTIGTPPKPYS